MEGIGCLFGWRAHGIMLVVGSGGNMIKEELDRKKMAELVRDIRNELKFMEEQMELNLDEEDDDFVGTTLECGVISMNERVEKLLQLLEG
jgi:hypothetical protein